VKFRTDGLDGIPGPTHSQNVSISEGRVGADVELPDPKTKVLVKRINYCLHAHGQRPEFEEC
jgi:hypothetical protein